MKNAKTILFASLIAAMILPFGSIPFAEAETDKIKIPKKLNDKKYYLLDQGMEMLQNMTKAERTIFFAQMENYLKNRNADQIEFDKELEILSKMMIEDKSDGKYSDINPSERAKKQFEVIQNLPIVKNTAKQEELFAQIDAEKDEAQRLGVEYEHKTYSMEELGLEFENEDDTFRDNIEVSSTIPKSVEFGHQVRITYPAMNWEQIPINLSVYTSHVDVDEYPDFLMIDVVSPRVGDTGGDYVFINYACLSDKGDMENYTTLDMYSARIILNAFGSTKYQDTEYDDRIFYWWSALNSCVFLRDQVTYTQAVLNDHAYHSSGIFNVQVS